MFLLFPHSISLPSFNVAIYGPNYVNFFLIFFFQDNSVEDILKTYLALSYYKFIAIGSLVK